MSLLDKVVAAVMPARKEGTNAIDLLEHDHDEVDKLFEEYEHLADDNPEGGDKRELSTQICGLLAVHAIIEEEIFYPAAREAGVDSKLLNEAEVEHGSVKELIAHIGESTVADKLYDARVQVLGEYVRHHVKEEENELFAACRKAEMPLDEIGARLQTRKDELMRKLRGE